MITSVEIRSAADALIAAKQDLDREITRTTESQRRRIEAELSDAIMVMKKSVLVLKNILDQIRSENH